MRKLTVRVDDKQGDAFAAFCASNGVSMQSTLVSMLIATIEQAERYGDPVVGTWPAHQAAWLDLITRARILDAAKRARKGRADPAP